MTLPDAVRRGAEGALEERRGGPAAIAAARPVGGGCINPAARVETRDGVICFLKWNDAAPDGFFHAEAAGLDALRSAAGDGGVRVPEVLGVSPPGAGTSWLLLEFIPEERPADDYGERLARGLARIHRTRGDAYGWEEDNFIGSLPQENGSADSWGAFWRDRRLGPQVELVRERGFFRGEEGRVLDDLLGRVKPLLEDAEADGPSLLHGDLWGGNAYPGPGGEPVLIDPAVYHGHREVDLAMMELFGGFDRDFHEHYREEWPVVEAYERFRRDLYQLYYLLVHVSLFGAGYVGRARAAAERVLGA